MFQRLSGAITVTLGLYLYLLMTGVSDPTSVKKLTLPLLSELLNKSEVDYSANPVKKKQAGGNFVDFFPHQLP